MFEYIKSPQNSLLLKLQFRFGFLFSDVLYVNIASWCECLILHNTDT